ncbi:42630_t:CDS:2 [Gigaspora margarita]|uniref:42630_t:CDS:1 n=1 Tax=Gigaspora margarita TaxID=4874 RepID=A0ABN7UKH2_GIGMA|nr:42630_t:CDS:2 [Gigaspora margarita]
MSGLTKYSKEFRRSDELQQRTKKVEIQLKTTCENLKIKIKKESLEEYFFKPYPVDIKEK